MTAALIRIDAEAYEAACTVVGQGVGLAVESAATSLLDALATSDAMAGSDAAGRSWAEGYDRSADQIFDVVRNVVTASFRLAALLEQTGFNYGRAEMASVPGGTVASSADTTSYTQWSCVLGAPPSAAGASSSIGAPAGWSLIEHLIGYVWPNGHQDHLRAAGSAWAALANRVAAAADYVPRATACLADQDAPETADAETACRSLSDQLRELAAACTAMADSCVAFAAHLDEAHSAVEHELVSLLEWTAVIEGSGALFSVVTLGASEAAAQTAEASRLASAAARIAGVLDRLAALARAAAETVANAGYRVAGVSDVLRPLLTSRIVVALVDDAQPLRVVESAAARAEERLVAVGAETGASNIATADLLAAQRGNLARFVKKLPAGAHDPTIQALPDGVVRFTSQVPGRVPGSYAIYTKEVDHMGVTISYCKTTVAPNGTIVHVKAKYP